MTATTAIWSPFRLGRYGGLPVDVLPAPDARVGELLAKTAGADRALAAQLDDLTDLLYAAVPAVGPRVRRRVLAAKRGVFAGTGTGLEAEPELGAELRDRCADWDRGVEMRDFLLDELRATLGEQEVALATALRSTLDMPEFTSALAVAAPDLVRSHLSGRTGPSSPKLLRTLYRYVARTSRKTSPFSGLTTVAEPGRPVGGRRFVAVAHHLAAQLLQTGALDGGDRLRLVPSPVHGRTNGDGELALVARHSFRDGIVFREETVVLADHVTPWVERVVAEEGSISVVAARAAVGGIDSATRLRRLLDAGVVRPVIPWARGQDPYAVLPDVLPHGVAGVDAEDLAVLRQVSEAFPGAPAATRVELLERVGAVSSRVFPTDALGDRPSGLVYEDCESPVTEPDPLATAAVTEDLDRLAELVEPAIFRSHLYDLMVQRFVAAYGSGGTCEEPLAFLMALAVDNDGDLESVRAFGQDMAATADDRQMRRTGGGPTAVARHLGCYLQLAAPSFDELDAGRGVTVVNMFGSGNGASQARYHQLFGAEYRNRLRRHAESLWRPEVVLELEVWASCNTGQAQSAGILPELRLPGEPDGPQGVGLDALRLCHDPVESTLFLAGSEPVGLAYLGLTPQHLLPSYFRWLALLADPWVRFPAFSDHSGRRFHARARRKGAVHSVARQQHGRLVTGRATWWVPLDRALFDVDDVAMVRSWHRLAVEHGMPTELFAHQSAVGSGSTDDTRKPLYVDTQSPLSLRCLERWVARDATEIVLVEALPDRHSHISRLGDKACVSEYLANVAWPEGERR